MNNYLKFFLFFLMSSFVYSLPDSEKEKEKEKKEDLSPMTEKNKIQVSSDMTHGFLLFFGRRFEIKDRFNFFIALNASIYSDIYDNIPDEEYKFSMVRTLHLELGFTYELVPFWGVSLSVYSKEFLNGGAGSALPISGGRISIFYHYSSWYIEGGFLIKENSQGILGSIGKHRSYGASLTFSVKFVKNSCCVGGMFLI